MTFLYNKRAQRISFGILLLINIGCSNTKNTSDGSYNNDEQKTNIRPASINYQYKILKREDNGTGENTFQNYSILLTTTDKSKENIKKSAVDLKALLCKVRCNIILYDDTTAYYLDKKFNDEEISLGERAANGELSKQRYKSQYANLERKYYVKIADHLIGSLMIDSEDLDYYPYRDWRYKELGGKK